MPSVGGDVLGYNMFAYCFNNPVNLSDTMGNWPRWVEAAAVAVSAAVLVAAVVATVAAVSAFTAGTGAPAAVYGATVLLGASLAGINGAVANASEGDSYLNGYVGGFVGGGTQAAASILPGGNIWGGALGAGRGTAITMALDNIDPDSSNSTFAEIACNAASSFGKGAVMGAFTQYWSSAVGGINYFSGVVEGAVADGASGLMPTLTLGFGEGIKAFFGWVDDAMVYIWK